MARKKKAKKEPMLQAYGGIAVVFSLIVLLHESTGFLGQFFYQLSRFLFGDFYYLLFAIAIIFGLMVFFMASLPQLGAKKITGLILMYIALMMALAIPLDRITGKEVFARFREQAADIFADMIPAGGGAIGTLLYGGFSFFISWLGSIIVIVALCLLGILLLVDIRQLKGVGDAVSKATASTRKKISELPKKVKKEKSEPVPPVIEDLISEAKPVEQMSFDEEEIDKTPVVVRKPEEKVEPKQENASVKTKSVGYSRTGKKYVKPRLSLLEKATTMSSTANRTNASEKGKLLIEILDQFDVPCTLTDAKIGPSVTKFFVRPEPGIKISRITSLQENIKMALAV